LLYLVRLVPDRPPGHVGGEEEQAPEHLASAVAGTPLVISPPRRGDPMA
jgi:hypothetical protein